MEARSRPAVRRRHAQRRRPAPLRHRKGPGPGRLRHNLHCRRPGHAAARGRQGVLPRQVRAPPARRRHGGGHARHGEYLRPRAGELPRGGPHSRAPDGAEQHCQGARLLPRQRHGLSRHGIPRRRTDAPPDLPVRAHPGRSRAGHVPPAHPRPRPAARLRDNPPRHKPGQHHAHARPDAEAHRLRLRARQRAGRRPLRGLQKRLRARGAV